MKMKPVEDKIEYIAEIGWNFLGDLKLAREMIFSAAEAGASIAKFQYWNPSKLVAGPWDLDGRREIYQNAYLDENKINDLMQTCNEAGIEFLLSAFNIEDAKYLMNFDIENIKIPSHCSHDVEFHRFAAENFQKIYVSLGACTKAELEEAVNIYNSVAKNSWILMHCVSTYPCLVSQSNLPRINRLKTYGQKLGFSDHTSDPFTPALSIPLGVRVIEKHFTINKDLPGRDNKFALDAAEFADMVSYCEHALAANIDHGIEHQACELDTINVYRNRWG